ncbi:hypothetical protein ACFYPA_12325 [Streptomyces sp. NPDC005775]|uniref:hypothetical protein n=1 Tax=unclassified Streptomyces TaxID=2593676 RepID=UPI0033E4A704
MLIDRYDDGPLVAGESLLARPGFWSNFLLAVCGDGASGARPVPEWFGDDGARIADTPSPAVLGVEEAAARLLLVLPLLTDPDVPEAAPARLSAALTSVGAPQDTASSMAEHLLRNLTGRARHDPTWGSPLSGN